MAAAGVFGKLQLKDQVDIVVLDAPESFETQLSALDGVSVHRKITAKTSFSLAFLRTQAQLESYARSIGKHAQDDAVIWVAYPKSTSKRYESQLGRDSGWKPLGDLGYEPVRIVAIDEDWSALRFRKAAFIKQMTRRPQFAISRAGKSRTSQARNAK